MDKLQKIDRLITLLDTDNANEFDEILKLLLKVIDEIKTGLDRQISEQKTDVDNKIEDISFNLRESELNLQRLINDSRKSSLADNRSLAEQLNYEIDRIEKLIPELPDLTDISTKISDIENKLVTIPLPDSPQIIADKVNTLHEVIKPEVLVGWTELKRKVDFTMGLPKDFDVRIGVSKTEIKRLTDRVVALEAGGGGVGAWTGFTIDGSTTTFSVTSEPTEVNNDGLILFNETGYSYNSGAGTITFDNPPQYLAGYR